MNTLDDYIKAYEEARKYYKERNLFVDCGNH